MKVLVACECSGVVRDAFRAKGHDAWSCDLLPDASATSDWSYHFQEDALTVARRGVCVGEHTTPSRVDGPPFLDYHKLYKPWDMMIAHPPCDYLATCAAWAFKDPDFAKYPGVGYHQKVKAGTLVGAARREAQRLALEFVLNLAESRIPLMAFENPVGALSRLWRKPTQIIQPHQFGDDASKATCLWLFGLPPLVPTQNFPPRIVNGRPRWGNQTDSGQNKLSPSGDRASLRAITYQGIANAMAAQWGALNTNQPTALP